MITVGLTGNYGMGKSSVTALFRKLGAHTIDSDEIVAGLLRNKSIIARIAERLGNRVLQTDGSLDKTAVAQLVFSRKQMRKRLEALLHPLVMEVVNKSIRSIRDRNRIVIVEVPLLFEGGFQGRFDRTITVHTNQKTALARLGQTGIPRKDALARLKTQMPIRWKKQLADYCINNNGTKRQTEAQVKKVYVSLVNENSLKLSMGRRRT